VGVTCVEGIESSFGFSAIARSRSRPTYSNHSRFRPTARRTNDGFSFPLVTCVQLRNPAARVRAPVQNIQLRPRTYLAFWMAGLVMGANPVLRSRACQPNVQFDDESTARPSLITSRAGAGTASALSSTEAAGDQPFISLRLSC